MGQTNEQARRQRRKREMALTFSPGEWVWVAIANLTGIALIVYGLFR